jgi:hypothetical protein
MTSEDIIRMAREAGGDDWGIFRDFMPEIERFANLVAAAEREACAKVCENEIEKAKPVYSVTAENALKVIRARGQG